MLQLRVMLQRTFMIWLFMSSAVFAQAVLDPPFELKWGDSPERLIDWARRDSLTTQITIPAARPDQRIMKVYAEGSLLTDTQANAVEARFQAGRLYEVCIHYGLEKDPVSIVEKRFNELKRDLSAEHGRLTANQQQRLVENHYVTRTIAFHREPVKGLFLLLAMTEIEDTLRKTRSATYSLIYRNDNLKQRLEAEAIDPNAAKGH